MTTRGDWSRRAFLAAAAAAFPLQRLISAPQGPNERKTLCLVSGSLEYKSDESLAAFQDYLEARHSFRCVRAFRRADDDLPGLEQLETCDVALFFTRRLTISGEQLEHVKRYCASGRPIVGVRTASHGFQNWLAMDREVFGGDYGKHYANELKTRIEIAPNAAESPLLEGFEPFESSGSLYRNRQIAGDTTLLLNGRIPDHVEPIAWTRRHGAAPVFYTSLGHPDDFRVEAFRKFLANGLLWATGQLG